MTPEEALKNWFAGDPSITTYFTTVYLGWFHTAPHGASPLTPFLVVHRIMTGDFYTLDGTNRYQDCHFRLQICADSGEDCITGRNLVLASITTLNHTLPGNQYMLQGEEWNKLKIGGMESASLPMMQLDFRFWTTPV